MKLRYMYQIGFFSVERIFEFVHVRIRLFEEKIEQYDECLFREFG